MATAQAARFKPTIERSDLGGGTGRSMGLWIAAVLALTFAVYLPSLGNGFTNWDDPTYVLSNPLVREPTVGAILTTPVAGNWHPLTIASYALNYRISGLAPSSYHWLNLLLHLANTALVFALVRALAPGRIWTIVATSLFFGIHPMHVESVAWISERKDVLYAFFYLAGLLAYLRYLRSFRWGWLGSSFVAFVLSVASKPAAIVFPLTLIAIDFYRRRPVDTRSVLEKAPFLLAAAGALLLTFHVQAGTGAINDEDIGPVFPRILIACHGAMMYVVKALVPIGLSAMYPYPKNPATSLGPVFYVALAFVAVLVPVIVLLCRRNRAILFGIAFFFINVFLVLQFVSVGRAVMADRYTYVPYVGLFFAVAWGLDARPAPRSPGSVWQKVLAVAMIGLVPFCLAQTWKQCHVWHDSGTLWTDVIVKTGAFDGYLNRGKHYFETGRDAEAFADFEKAASMNPKSGRAYASKGSALARMGRSDEAVACLDRAIELDPKLAEAWSNRAGLRLQRGDLPGAISDLGEAIRLNPEFRGSYVNRGTAYTLSGDKERALVDYKRAIELEPAHPKNYEVWGAMGEALVGLRRAREAIDACDQAIRLAPANAPLRDVYRARGRAWLELGDGAKAARDSLEAVRLGGK